MKFGGKKRQQSFQCKEDMEWEVTQDVGCLYGLLDLYLTVWLTVWVGQQLHAEDMRNGGKQETIELGS